MKAAVIGTDGVEIRDVPKPKPAANEVLVRVRAAGLNRADVIMASGRMHGSAGGPGAVLGLEFAGEVEAVGAEVRSVKAGDRVMCSGTGGYAEYAVTDWGRWRKSPPTTWAGSRRQPCRSRCRRCTTRSSPPGG